MIANLFKRKKGVNPPDLIKISSSWEMRKVFVLDTFTSEIKEKEGYRAIWVDGVVVRIVSQEHLATSDFSQGWFNRNPLGILFQLPVNFLNAGEVLFSSLEEAKEFQRRELDKQRDDINEKIKNLDND